MRYCPKIVASSTSSDRPPSHGGLSKEAASNVDVDIVESDEYSWLPIAFRSISSHLTS